MTEYDRIVKAFLKPLRKTIKSSIKVSREHPWSMEKLDDKKYFYTYLTYGHMLSLARSLERLISVRHYAGAIAVARSMLETHADIMGLARNDSYPALLDAISNRELEKYLNVAEKNPELPVFESLLEDVDLDQLKEDIRKAIDEANDAIDSNSGLSVFARFSMAGLKDFYEQYYRALSQPAHGNVTDLVKRYLTFGSSFVRFRWPPLRNAYGSDMVMIVSFIPRLLVDSANAFLELHGEKSHRRIEESLESLQKTEGEFEDRIITINEKRRADLDELAARLQGS